MNPRDADRILDEEFLTLRAKILEVGAALDRVERGDGDIGSDSRMANLKAALDLLLTGGPDRAEKIQLLFSRPYDESWRKILD